MRLCCVKLLTVRCGPLLHQNWLRRDLLRIHQRIQAEELAASPAFQLHPERTGACDWLSNWIRSSSTGCFNWETGERPGDLQRWRSLGRTQGRNLHSTSKCRKLPEFAQETSGFGQLPATPPQSDRTPLWLRPNELRVENRSNLPRCIPVALLGHQLVLLVHVHPQRPVKRAAIFLHVAVFSCKDRQRKRNKTKAGRKTKQKMTLCCIQKKTQSSKRCCRRNKKKEKLKLNEFKFYFRLRLDRSWINTCWSHPHEYSRPEQSVKWAGDQVASRTKSVWRSSVYLRRQKNDCNL